MPQCGDKYQALVRNALGYTADNPCGAYCNDADHASWNSAAIAMLNHKVGPAWRVYANAALEQGVEVDPAVSEQAHAFEAAVKGLDEPSAFHLPGEQARRVALAKDATQLGACVLEEIEKATKALGARPPAAPSAGTDTPPPKLEDDDEGSGSTAAVVLGLLTVGAIGGAIYWHRKKSSDTNEDRTQQEDSDEV